MVGLLSHTSVLELSPFLPFSVCHFLQVLLVLSSSVFGFRLLVGGITQIRIGFADWTSDHAKIKFRRFLLRLWLAWCTLSDWLSFFVWVWVGFFCTLAFIFFRVFFWLILVFRILVYFRNICILFVRRVPLSLFHNLMFLMHHFTSFLKDLLLFIFPFNLLVDSNSVC